MKQLIIPDLQKEMEAVDHQLSLQLAPIAWDPKVNRILSRVRRAEGKMIRPQILLLCASYGSRFKENQQNLCLLAALTEMVHMASLIHDDIVDDSPTRRGMPTVQAEFGKDMAVYTGDLLIARVMKVLFSQNMMQAGSCFARTIEHMCTGEIGQYDCYFDTAASVERYMNNIYGKTAAIFEMACCLGCMESGCDETLTKNLTAIGKKLGLLFQIRDDLLDFTLSDAVDGKPSHMDFREGILTLPVLYGLENADCKEEIRALVSKAKSGTYTRADEMKLNQLLAASGGMDRARQTAGLLVAELRTLTEGLPKGRNSTCFFGMIRKLSDVI